MVRCHREAEVIVDEAPDPQGRYAAYCAECGTILALVDDRDELFITL